MLLNFRLQSLFPAIWNYTHADFPAAFQDSRNGRLVLTASTSDAALTLGDMHVASLTPERLIGLDLARQFTERALVPRAANPVHHKPRRLFVSLRSPVNLV
jgi:hypothetical protein